MKDDNNRVVIMVIFLIVSFFYAIMAIGYGFSYRPGLFPDESSHLGYVMDVVRNNFPDYVNGTNLFDNKFNHLNHPFLYYWVTGEIISVFHLQMFAVVTAKIINTGISLLIVYYTVRFVRIYVNNSFATLLGCSFLLLPPMFIELGAAANNDPLNILSCVLFLYGLASCDSNLQEGILTNLKTSLYYILFGAVIASLSKATGALVIVCLIMSYVAIRYKSVIIIFRCFKAKEWILSVSAIIFVLLYYLFIYHEYGRFFPAPQGNPATWFALDNMNETRIPFVQYLDFFYQANIFTFAYPYGYGVFDDVSYRAGLVKSVLVLIFVAAVILQVMVFIKPSEKAKMFTCYSLAFCIFIFLYFLTTKKMYDDTGYLGGVQARYFFGFIPVLCLILAKFYSLLTIRFLKLSCSLLILVSVMFSIYISYAKLLDYDRLSSRNYLGQTDGEDNDGELIKGREFKQTFIAPGNHISGGGVYLATYLRQNHGVLLIEVTDDRNYVISKTSISLSEVKNYQFNTFIFDKASLIKGRQYSIQLKCNECTKSNAITWLMQHNSIESPLFVLNKFGPGIKDVFPDGDAYIDGKKVNSDFRFKLYF